MKKFRVTFELKAAEPERLRRLVRVAAWAEGLKADNITVEELPE